MRQTEITKNFKRDFRKYAAFEMAFVEVIWKLANDEPLPVRYQDHALTGNWQGFRDCHIKPDLVLIYAKPDATTLQLVRMGSHAELGW